MHCHVLAQRRLKSPNLSSNQIPSPLQTIKLPLRRNPDVVIHVLAIEPEQLEKHVLVPVVAGDPMRAFGGSGSPQDFVGFLYALAQFPTA